MDKCCGVDGISAEHLKYASDLLVTVLCKLLRSFYVHGYLPDSLMTVVLVPVIKDRSAKISSIDSYRPIAVANTLSKLVEILILDHIEMYVTTHPYQFGFKPKHGTDKCIYVFKEIIDMHI